MGIIRTLLTLLIFHVVSDAQAQDVRVKAEAEGKLMMYATFTAADSKTLLMDSNRFIRKLMRLIIALMMRP